MLNGRCLFAAIAIEDKFIYVYGGIMSSNSRRPKLVENLLERYDVTTNMWSTLIVEDAPKLSAFGWTTGQNEFELLILGGSDGSTLQDDLWSIDLKALKARKTDIHYESATGSNKLATIKDPKSGELHLHVFGGSQSNG